MAEKRKRKKPRKRVPKEDRKNMRLWAEGARETVLKPHIEGYADALERGWRAERDYLQSVCNEFHARIDWRLADHEEPDLPLAEYDPLKTVEAEDVDPEVEKAQRTRMLVLNARIQRWLKYRVRRLQKNVQSKHDPLKDPWAILVALLSGVKRPPKARQAYQQFMHEAYDDVIAPEVEAKWEQRAGDGSNVQTSKTPNGPFRSLIARELFGKLSDAERAGYAARAKAEATEAREAYEAAMKAPPSKAPEDRDKCIAAVGKFLGPIMKGVFDRTGMHCCFLMGGPVPKFGGELRTIYASYGRNRMAGGGAHFPEWAGPRFSYVTDLMKEYLSTAFSAQDKAEAALPDVLTAAKYTLLPDKDDNASDSDSSSSEESESDSNVDSDDTDAPPKKRTRVSKGKGRSRKEPKKGALDSGDETQDGNDQEDDEEQGERTPEWKIGDPESAFVPTQEERNLYGGGAHGRNQAMVARRNALMLAPLRAEWREVLGPQQGAKKVAKPKPRAKRKAQEDTTVQPRKSRRLNEDKGQSTTATPPADPLPPSTAASTSGSTAPPLTMVPPPPPPLPSTAPSTVPSTAPSTAPSTEGPPPPPLPSTAPSIAPTESPPLLSTAHPPPPSTEHPPASPPPSTASTAPNESPPLLSTAHPPPPSTEHPPASPPPSTASTAPFPPPAGAAIQLDFPEDAPDWLRSALSYLTERDLGCHYVSLLKALVRLEESAGFDNENPTSLPTAKKKKTRPKEVGLWIKGGRGVKMTKLPEVRDVHAYQKQWYSWWDELQPQWRQRSADGELITGGEYGDSWGHLDCSGVNGTLSIVASLYFWGTAGTHTEESLAAWNTAVQDVTWMLEGVDTLFE